MSDKLQFVDNVREKSASPENDKLKHIGHCEHIGHLTTFSSRCLAAASRLFIYFQR
jgi:hypothetical protein